MNLTGSLGIRCGPLIRPPVSRLEVISTGPRRRWTLSEKWRIVAQSYSAPVSAMARRNGLSASQLFNWRRLAREGRLGIPDRRQLEHPVIVIDVRSSQRVTCPAFLSATKVLRLSGMASPVAAL